MNGNNGKKLGARAYVLVTKQMHPDIYASNLTHELIAMKMYTNKQYNTTHKWVSRCLERGSVEDKKREKENPKTNTTTVKRIEQIHKRTKGTTSGSVRGIKDIYESKYNDTISVAATHKILYNILKKRARSIPKTQKLNTAHKAARVVTAKYLLRKYGSSPQCQTYLWGRILNTDFSKHFRIIRPINSKNDKV